MTRHTSRRRLLQLMAGSAAAGSVRGLPALSVTPSPVSNDAREQREQKPTLPGMFNPLPLGAIRPAGWLRRQLRIQAEGLTGHLHDFWPDVGTNSGWLGGTGESWERGPYYLDGLLPLAVLLDDARLRTIADKFVNWTLTHQRSNGMIGPASNDDWWPRMVMVKVLAQYFEATGDQRVIPVLTRYFHHQLAALPTRPLRDWGKYRWQDEAYLVQWLYGRTHDPKLLELGRVLQAQGFDWVSSFAHFEFKEKVDKGKILSAGGENSPEGYQCHGVNNGQALKTAAVQARLGDMETNRAGFYRQLAALDRYHGMPTGMFTCDEHLAGTSPSQGTELCTVVETMFSLEIALAVFGDVALGDRIEKIAYNALPATLTADMWAHQYDQQVNQVQCSLNTKPWTTNSAESNLFGLAPHFGCCTANYHQGWPKLVASLWMRRPDDGLAATIYGPCEVNTTVRGTEVRLVETTEYPFRESIAISVHPQKRVRFPLHVRIPEWADAARVLVNGREQGPTRTGAFLILDREWLPGDVVELKLPMQPRVSRWQNKSVAVERGPLLFSFSPGEHWVKLRDQGMTPDWQVFPDRAWNYAVRVKEQSAAHLPVTEGPIAAEPFSAESKPVQIAVPAQLLNSWRTEDGVAPPPPQSPVPTSEEMEMITLVPYGTARLRTTVFPEAT